MPLTENNVKAELSYGLLHAIAARAQFGCEIGGRHSDDLGIDARIIVKDDFGEEAPITEFVIEMQLKATSRLSFRHRIMTSFAPKRLFRRSIWFCLCCLKIVVNGLS